MEKINWEVFSDSHLRVRERELELRNSLDENAKRHIQRGLIMRLGMMESAIVTFYNEIGKSTEPLSHYLVFEISLLLNAYYLNLVGSLDNIAWALTYYHDLLDQINEDNQEHRRFVSLLGNRFLQRLRDRNLQEFAKELSAMKDWLSHVKNFRDPAAHRIPLHIPPAFYSSDDIEKRNELDYLATQFIRNGKYKEGANLTYAIEKLGTHIPKFITESPEMKYYDLAKQVNEDHQAWLGLVDLCLNKGFRTNLASL